MITTEYSVAGPAHISIAIVADLHEFEPKPLLDILLSPRKKAAKKVRQFRRRRATGNGAHVL